MASQVYHQKISVFFAPLIFAWGKYNPQGMDYYPRHDSRLDGPTRWILRNTPKDASFLALTADGTDMALIMQHRPMYLGFIGHVAHLGLNWGDRRARTIEYYSGQKGPEGVDFIFYGPVERKYFPDATLAFPVAFRDTNVVVFQVP